MTENAGSEEAEDNPLQSDTNDEAGLEQAPEELSDALARADENWNKYLRLAAEMENLRKRAGRDAESARKYGAERFAAELLAVVDSLEMGLEAGSGASVESLLEGKAATLKLLLSAMEKFDISTGSAVHQYDSPYLGDYAFSGNLWFSNDGTKFVARSRYLFHASADSLSDMVYAGALSVNRIVECAVQSQTNDKWYVSHTNWNDEVSNEVNIYDGTFFQFESSVTVPDVPNLTHVGPNPFSAVGARYVAVNSAGTKLHVVGRRVDDNVWAVASIEL